MSMVGHPFSGPGNIPPNIPSQPLQEPWKEVLERLDKKIGARAVKLMRELVELAEKDDLVEFTEKITQYAYAHDVYPDIRDVAHKMDEKRFVELRARAEALQSFFYDTQEEAEKNPDGPAPGRVILIGSIMQGKREKYDVATEYEFPRFLKDRLPQKLELISLNVQLDKRGNFITPPQQVAERARDGSNSDTSWLFNLPRLEEHLKATMREQGPQTLLFKVKRVEGSTSDARWVRRQRIIWLDPVGEFAKTPSVTTPAHFDATRRVFLLSDNSICKIPQRFMREIDLTTGYMLDPMTKKTTGEFPQIHVQELRVHGAWILQVADMIPREVSIRRNVPHVAKSYLRVNKDTAYYTLADGKRYWLHIEPRHERKIDVITGMVRSETGDVLDSLPFVKVAFDPMAREFVVKEIAPASYHEKIRQVTALMRYYALQPLVEHGKLTAHQKQMVEQMSPDSLFSDISPDLAASLREKFSAITKEHPHYVVVSARADSFRFGFDKCAFAFKILKKKTAPTDAATHALLDELMPLRDELHELYRENIKQGKLGLQLDAVRLQRLRELHVSFFKKLGVLEGMTKRRLRLFLFPSDMDGEMSIDLLRSAGGIHSVVIPVIPNEARAMLPLLERMIHVDISHDSHKSIQRAPGKRHQRIGEQEYTPLTIFLDEDGKTRYSALAAVADHLRFMGMLPREKMDPDENGVLNLMVEFVSAIDAYRGPFEDQDALGKIIAHWGENIYGIAHALIKEGRTATIVRFFKEVGPDILIQAREEALKRDPQLAQSPAVLHNRIKKISLELLATYNAQKHFASSDSKYMRVTGALAAKMAAKELKKAHDGFEWLQKMGFVVETDAGRALIDIAQIKMVPYGGGEPYYLGKFNTAARAYAFAPTDADHRRKACNIIVNYRPSEVDGTPLRMGTVNVAPWSAIRLNDQYLKTSAGQPIGNVIKNGRYFVMNPLGARLQSLAQLLGPLCKKSPDGLPVRDEHGKLEQFLRFERGTAANPFEGEVVGGIKELPPRSQDELNQIFDRHADTLFKGITAEHMTLDQAQLIATLVNDGTLEKMSADRGRPQDRLQWEQSVERWWHQRDAFTRDALAQAAQHLLEVHRLRERIETNALMFAGILQTRSLAMRAELYRRLKANEPPNLNDEGVTRALGDEKLVPAFEKYIRDQWFATLTQGERYFWEEQLRNKRPLARQIEQLSRRITYAKQQIYRQRHAPRQLFGLKKIKDRSQEMANLVHWQEQLKVAQREWHGTQIDQWMGEQLAATYEQLDRVAAGRGWETGAVAALGDRAIDKWRVAIALIGVAPDTVRSPLDGVLRSASEALARMMWHGHLTQSSDEQVQHSNPSVSAQGTLFALQQAINRQVLIFARQGVSLEEAWNGPLAPLLTAYERALSRMSESEMASQQCAVEFLERAIGQAHRDMVRTLRRARPNLHLFEQPSRDAIAGMLTGIMDRVASGHYEKHALEWSPTNPEERVGLRFERTVQPHDTVEGIVDGFIGKFHGVQIGHKSGVRERAVRRFLSVGVVDDPQGTFGQSLVALGRYTGTLHVGDMVTAVQDASAPFGFRLHIKRASATGVHRTHVDVDAHGRPEWLYEQRASDQVRVWRFGPSGAPHYAGVFVKDHFEQAQLRTYEYTAPDGAAHTVREDAMNVLFRPDGYVVTVRNPRFGIDDGEEKIGTRASMPTSLPVQRNDGTVFALNLSNGEYRIAPSGEVFQRFPNNLGMRRIGFVDSVAPLGIAPPVMSVADTVRTTAIIQKQKLRSPFATDAARQTTYAQTLDREVFVSPERSARYEQVVGAVHQYVRKTAALLLGRYPDELKDDGWARWDIAKQLYYWRHPRESDQPYPIGDPLALDGAVSHEVVQQIADRMLGYLVSSPTYQEQAVQTIGTYEIKKEQDGSKKGRGSAATSASPQPRQQDAKARKSRVEAALEVKKEQDDKKKSNLNKKQLSTRKSTGVFPSWKLAEIGRVFRTERKIPALHFEGGRLS